MIESSPDYPSNPFCTRRTRPGAIAYLFPEGETIGRLVDRLRSIGWRGQVLGPHGTGKSTLLAALCRELPNHGRDPLHVRVAFCQGRLPRDVWRAVDTARAASVVVVDGYEQLSLWTRFWLNLRCRQRSLGLLVTAHRRLGLPVLYRTGVTPEAAARLFDHLVPPGSAVPVTAEDMTERLAKTTNVREVLFELYDLYERRIREEPAETARSSFIGLRIGPGEDDEPDQANTEH